MRVLGPLEVRVDGFSRRLGPPKQRALLALLLLHGQMVPTTRITEELWGESPPISATANLRTYVAGLRRMLPTEERHRFVARPAGYLLMTGPDELDAVEFELMAIRGRRALDGGDPVLAVRELERALSLWRGHVGEDVRAGSVLTPLIEVLEERRRSVLEDCIEARLMLGECAQVIPQLRSITATQPLRERGWALLMRALSAAGDPAAALEAFSAARTALVTTLGIEPGDELRRRHRMILNAEAAVAASHFGIRNPKPLPRDHGPSAVGSWRVRCQLPAQVRGLVGRERDVHEVSAGLRSESDRLVMVTGPPGVGKTAVAIAVAHRLRSQFPDGQWFVRMHDDTQRPRHPAAIRDELLRGCGEARDLSVLAERRVLMILDDAGSASQVRPLLPGTASSAVIVTSREVLPGLMVLDGAQVRPLEVLAPAQSRGLLIRLLGEEVVAAHGGAADDVLDLCGGLPLALRIAAANISAGGGDVAAYAARLRGGDPLSALAADGDEQVALRRSFDRSYRRLSADARCLFRRLGMIRAAGHLGLGAAGVGGLSLDAVAALYGADQETTRQVLVRLVAAGLVERSDGGQFRLHELLRLYAREHANAEESAGERSQALARLQNQVPRPIPQGRPRCKLVPAPNPAGGRADTPEDLPA